MLAAQSLNPFDWIEMAAWATVVTAVLLVVGLIMAFFAGSTFLEVLRRQADELARLRVELVELRQRQPAPEVAEDESVARIGGSTPVFQVGDAVAVVSGMHRGDLGTIAPAPDWLRDGYVCVALARDGSQRYLPAAALVSAT